MNTTLTVSPVYAAALATIRHGCPTCGWPHGFHNRDVHDQIVIPPGKRLPPHWRDALAVLRAEVTP